MIKKLKGFPIFSFLLSSQLAILYIGYRTTLERKALNIERNSEIVPAANDSAAIINELYHGSEIFESKNYGDFSFKFRKNAKAEVTITSGKKIDGYEIRYFIVQKDTAGVYNPAQFSAESMDYKFLESYFLFNDIRIPAD